MLRNNSESLEREDIKVWDGREINVDIERKVSCYTGWRCQEETIDSTQDAGKGMGHDDDDDIGFYFHRS